MTGNSRYQSRPAELMANAQAILYRLTFHHGKVYIGITRQTLEQRVRRHVAYARQGRHFAISCAIRKHGEDSFRSEVMAFGSWSEMLNAEIDAIAEHRLRGISCYNMTDGGEGSLGVVPSAEKRQRISASLSGRSLSAEHRQRVGESQRGKTIPEHVKDKMSAAAKGRVISVEQRQAVSAKLAGKKRPPELMQRIWETRKRNAGI